jgi:glycosyltransferase involved in cell wall biosynthesis
MSKPTVSFIVTAHNYGRYLPDALNSLLMQTFREFEAIVIDDASTDDTLAVLEPYQQDKRIRVIHHEVNVGNIASYNEGLSAARGRYVAILSADDWMTVPDAVERQVALFEQDPDVGLVYSAHDVVQEGTLIKTVRPWPEDAIRPGIEEFQKLIWGNYILHSGAMLRTELATELGPYTPELPHSGDWDMWLRAAARGNVGYVAAALYAYRLHRSNMFHTRMEPGHETLQVVRTVERAYASLPADAPSEVIGLRAVTLSHAYLQTAWFDTFNGRRRRAWKGLWFSVCRNPGLVARPETWRLGVRMVLMTVGGRDYYRRFAGWREESRHRLPATDVAR